MNRVIKLWRTPRTCGLLLLEVVTLLYVGWALYLQGQLPADGALWMDFSNAQVQIAMSYEPQSVWRSGDKIVAIEGVPLEQWVERTLRNAQPPDWKLGQTLHYQIIREGTSQKLAIELATLPASRLLLLRSGIYLLAALGLGIGTYSLLKYPQSSPARCLFLATLSIVPPFLLHIQVGLLTLPWFFILQNTVKILSRSLLASAFFHLTLIFPQTKIPAKYQRWLPGLHLLPFVIALSIALLRGAARVDVLILTWQAITWLALGMLLGSAVNIIHTYATVKTITVRNQIRWVGWGAVLGGLPYLVLTGLPEALLGHALVNLEITAFSLICMPLSLAIAIAKYRIFDIDALIRRSVLYLLFIIFLAGAYQFIFVLLEFLSRQIIGEINEPLIIFGATLCVVTLFWHYQERVAGLVGRLFYHARGEPRLMLSEMSAHLSREIDFDAVVVLLAATVPLRMGASGARLWVWEEAEDGFVSVHGDGWTIPLANFPAQWTVYGNQPIRLALAPSWMQEETRALFGEQNLALLLPLMLGERMIGIWGIGMPPMHLPYTTEELRALQTLSYQAAVAVQNARLVRRLEEYSGQLELQVLQRTQALEQERDQLNAILQNMVDGLLVTGAEGKVILVNAAFERIVRHAARRIVGRPLEETLALPALQQLIDRASRLSGRAEIVDITWQQHIFRTSAVALGDSSTVITLLRDVTREVELDRLKSDFISGISHELRTPLTSILGFTKLVQRTFDRSIFKALPAGKKIQRGAKQIQQNLEIMLIEGERLTTLINDVLEISALESGRAEWHDSIFDPATISCQVVDQMRPLAEEKGLALHLTLAEDLPPLVADPKRIQQAIQQLLSNALKFTTVGHIGVTVDVLAAGQHIHGASVPEKGALLFAVSDTGDGIAVEAQEQLFERFQQFGDVMHAKPRGVGLGLVICHEIVTHYGGDIWVESALGQGSTFTFYLPLKDSEEKPPAPEQPEVQYNVTHSDTLPLVLAVDDDPAIRSLLTQELTADGLRVQAVAWGGEAVAQARAQSPDLILLDLQLPDISGFDVLQILKAHADTASIPVVMLSAADVQQHSLELGAAAYLAKPIDGERLLETIWNLLAIPECSTEETHEETHAEDR
ncbi:MAG: ATP-binding protein [Chloroflexota bacterium]|nr:ATP-binding protein [Chloroflexota bacterium]